MKNKKLVLGMFLLGIVFTILGTTFAYWNWATTEEQKTNVVFTVTGDFSCAADGGGNITSNDLTLIPTTVTDATGSNYIKREIKVKPTLSISGIYVYMDLWLDINDIGIGLSNSDNFMYAFTTGSTSPTDGVVASGNFKDKTVGDKIELLSAKNYSATTTDTYYLWIWLDAAETSTSTMNQTFSLSLNGSCSDYLTVTADTLIEHANPSTLLYANATDEQKGEMWTFSHEATAQVGATTDYRYIGKKPNNYITFNNEVWRIIGVFDGRIKIIRNDPLGNMPWDYKKYGVGSAGSTGNSNSGSNDWTDSQLMYMLNSTNYKLKKGYTLDENYIKDGSGNIIYQLGCKPAAITAGATSYSCTENTWSLNATALSQISETTYYLGGTTVSTNKNAPAYYNFERGKAVYNSVRQFSWIGLVGLMYPSDFAYTFANGVNNTCYNDTYSCTGADKSWLYNSEYQWTISPYSSDLSSVFVIDFGYRLHVRDANGSYGIRPVVYLISGIKLIGSGTSTEPYEIVG